MNIEKHSYDHANELIWSTPRLTRRLAQIAYGINYIPHSAARREQLEHESDCIAFELYARNGVQPGEIDLFMDKGVPA